MTSTAAISKNLSHRRLIKQRTQQPIYYPHYVPKSATIMPVQGREGVEATKRERDLETSICLERSAQTSLSKRLNEERSGAEGKIGKSGGSEKGRTGGQGSRRPNIGKFKSVELKEKKKQSSVSIQPCFSVKKLSKNYITASQPRLASIQQLQVPQPFESTLKAHQSPYMPRSETDLKQSLKKSSATKLKLRIKDPFEKRIKLDLQFKDQSAIDRREDSMISTVNQEEFRDILSRIL